MEKTREYVKKVDDKTLTFWRSKRFHGDIALIQKETGISRLTIATALNRGLCSDRFLGKINNYFTSKP